MSITKYYASLMQDRKSFNNDPIKRMIIPQLSELNLQGSYDTSGEMENTKMPGFQHKYSQTALILTTNKCASYCRYCFRKRLLGIPTEETLKRFGDALKYIKEHKEINNILISGGDPLILSTRILENFLEKLTPIEHIRFIRFGTKIPVVFPTRIIEDRTLLDMFRHYSRKDKRIYIVTQFNHSKEITKESTMCIDKLLKAGTIVNNQTVLLRGVNDNPETISELQNNLVSIGVGPYYVFQCRPVKRVKLLYQVPLLRGYHIIEDAKKELNGHSKRFKFIMSHRTGKIEIIGIKDNYFIFKYHQAKNPKNLGKIFMKPVNKTAGWLDDL